MTVTTIFGRRDPYHKDHPLTETVQRTTDTYMKKNMNALAISQTLDQFASDIQKISSLLIDLVHGDQAWWQENLRHLASQPLDSLKVALKDKADGSFSNWEFMIKQEADYAILEPLEALVWLVALCRLDRFLIGALPREFVDELELQWRVLALHWIN